MARVPSKLVPGGAFKVVDADQVGETSDAKVMTAAERSDVAALPDSSSQNLWDDALFVALKAKYPTAATTMYLDNPSVSRAFVYGGTPEVSWDDTLSAFGNSAVKTEAGNTIDITAQLSDLALEVGKAHAISVQLWVESGTTVSVYAQSRTSSSPQTSTATTAVVGNDAAQEISLGALTPNGSTDRLLIRTTRSAGSGAFAVCAAGVFSGTLARPITEDSCSKSSARALALDVADHETRLDAAEPAIAENTASSALANMRLNAWAAGDITQVEDSYLDRSGAAQSASSYRYATAPIPDGATRVRIGTDFHGALSSVQLISWYSDTGASSYLSRVDGEAGANYRDEVFEIPASARSIGVDGYNTHDIEIEFLTDAPLSTAADVAEIRDGISSMVTQTPKIAADGYYIAAGGDIQTVGASDRYAFFDIGGGETFTVSTDIGPAEGYYAIHYYDAAGDQISAAAQGVNGSVTQTDPNTIYTTPTNTTRVGISGRTSAPIIFNKKAIGRILVAQNGFSGLHLATFGDSITGQGRWQPKVIEALEFGTHTNCGVGGSTVGTGGVSSFDPMVQDSRINAIPTGADVILFMGGTNDMGQSEPLGSITPIAATSFDTSTYYGALETVATKLLARFSSGQLIVWMTPPLGRWDARTSWVDPYTNAEGLRIEDYCAALTAVAYKYGFPVIDLRGRLGWNTLNLDDYLDAEGNVLHPSEAVGGPRMGALIPDELINLARTAALI
ncbi:SGNH/GDSL hydrolase family protein [Stakelama tenebrarum]|uniref:SGNH/GDSL hydrolase family protein n=1 Tax=Stakelama tenebrarum TaxID=2711215 RepID=A0A6G6Y5J9_9SPHN|nr:SGNH/GDSL hydrolase family protein [Sphingosinithalassobacter tenebrarum]QIG79998.1 SGNH/GDSL hydrolase family protein [Sphingosinithalassobacter tenebrarum]